jgi:Putative prokaryotic signal transducing protein
MKAIRGYWFRVEADLARIALEGAGIPAVVVGVDLTIAGAIGNGVQLLVPEERVQAARQVLDDFEKPQPPPE